MKVLNWVTRRFLNAQSCIAVLPDEDRENDSVNSKYDVEETQALLEHGAHLVMDIYVLEDWKDGILAIGTLAIGPLENDTFEIIEEVHNTSDQQEYCEHNLNNNNVSENLEENKVAANTEMIEEETTKNVVEIEENEDFAEDEWQTSKKRVTLADLFLADSDHKLVKRFGDNKLHHEVDVSKDMMVTAAKACEKMIKPNSRTKHGQSKAKKLLKEDLHPIKKLNQLMKRMMKKKIHPDVEGKMQADMEMQPRNDIIGSPAERGGSRIQ